MRDDLIASARLKFGRGKKHLNTLRKRVLKWGEDDTDSVVTEPHPEPHHLYTRFLFIARNPKRVPTDEWSPLAGDCLHNFRGVLDHLVWGLSILNGPLDADGLPPNPKSISFPIYDDSEKYSRQGLHAVAPDVPALVDAMQPYHAGNAAHDHPLWVLHELSNIDKHRIVPIVAQIPVRGDAFITPRIYGTKFEMISDRYEDSAVIAMLSVPKQPYGTEVEVQRRIARGICIEKTATTPILHLGKTLDAIEVAVRLVMETLEPAFG